MIEVRVERRLRAEVLSYSCLWLKAEDVEEFGIEVGSVLDLGFMKGVVVRSLERVIDPDGGGRGRKANSVFIKVNFGVRH